jgi:hypothetical protein
MEHQQVRTGVEHGDPELRSVARFDEKILVDSAAHVRVVPDEIQRPLPGEKDNPAGKRHGESGFDQLRETAEHIRLRALDLIIGDEILGFFAHPRRYVGDTEGPDCRSLERQEERRAGWI